MTFEVYLDEQLLFYPNDEAYVITNGTVEQALNEAGAFECDVPSTNPLYSDLESKVRKGMIRVVQNGTELFYGEIREVTQNFNMTKHVYAVGELAFLFDSIQPQSKYQTTPYNVFKSILDKHNSQVESKKQFKLGYVTVTDSNDYIYRFTNYEDTLTALREKMCDTLDGFLRIRKVNGIRYLDLINLENYGSYCKQEIQFGENLLDYSCNTSANEIATAVIPLGKRLEDDERTSDAIEGLDQYLTIKGKETYTEGTQTKTYSYDKDYVINQTAVNKFGYVKVVKHWEDITLKRNLKAKAEEWLKSVQFSTMELQINAFDGNLLDINVDSFDVGDTVHAWALPYGMDTTFPVRKKTTYINDVSKNLITLGSTASKSYTSQASKAITLVEEQLPEESEMLRNAKNNALAMLNGSIGGHVIFKFDTQNKYVEELLICNASTEENSTQMWKWNLNGLGFMSRKTAKDSWTDLSTAITMDGKIVANFITSGVMSADRMRGGILEIGGNGTGKNGQILVKNESGTTLIALDKSGMKLSNGQTISWNNISDKPSIPDSLDDLSGQITTTQITDNAITTAKINANAVTAGKISVNSLSAISANMGSVNVGGNNNTNGILQVKDANGNVKVTLNNDGIKAEKGYIGKAGSGDGYGFEITDTAIRNKVASATDTSNVGAYYGVNGMRVNSTIGSTYVGGGIVNTNYVLSSKYIATDGYVEAHNYYTWEDGTRYQGKDTKGFSFKVMTEDGEEKSIGLKFLDGLLVGVSGF